MLSWTHLCWKLGLGCAVTLYLQAAATQQGCDTRAWLCLSAQPVLGRAEWCGTEVTAAWAIFGICPWQLSPAHYLKPFFHRCHPGGEHSGLSAAAADQSCSAVSQSLVTLCLNVPGLPRWAHWACSAPWDTQLRPEGPQRSIQAQIPPSAGAMSSHPQERAGQVCDACLLFPLPPGTCSWASWMKADEVCSLATSFHLFSSSSQ